MSKLRPSRVKCVCLIAICSPFTSALCEAQTVTTLVTFDISSGPSVNVANAPAGSGSEAPLVQGRDGNFYGTTALDGAEGYGTVFKMTPGGVLTTLHNFSNGTDGSSPASALTQGVDGNFYGTTLGVNGVNGTVFKVTLGGALTTLHTFTGYPDGQDPYGSLIQASDGNFYGTTRGGGAKSGGTIFRVTPGGVLTVVYSFAASQSDGYAPQAGLVQGSDGNLYGTTRSGGGSDFADNYYYGTIFRITLGGVYTQLHSFNGVDGALPNGPLIQSTDGNLYGTTNMGGPGAGGTVFRIGLDGTLTTIYSFSFIDGPSGPTAALVQGKDGFFYGTGSQVSGYVFKVTPGGGETVLYTFPRGTQTTSGLIQGADGNFYGTMYGYDGTAGTVFRFDSGYACSNAVPPVIASVDSASAYGGYPYFASGSWLEIKGTNMADPNDPRLSAATNPGQWTSTDFSGANAPTSLDGISVTVNGKPAFVWYLSPGQLNVQAPEDTVNGDVAITVTNCNATSPPFTFARRALAPGLLAPSNYSANGTRYMVATFQSDGAYVLNSATGASFGLNSRPAKPGDGVIAYGVGFGDVTPLILPGVIVGQNNTLVNPVTISFGTTQASVAYAGLAGGFIGLYEFYFTVPPTLANGDYQINVTQNGAVIPQMVYLTVHN